MNENIDLTKILKDCPKGTKFYHLIYNKVYFVYIDENSYYPIRFSLHTNGLPVISMTKDGKRIKRFDGKCIIFPSKKQRDWSKFTAPWYKQNRFDPKTLKPFDKVIVLDDIYKVWFCTIFSHQGKDCRYPYETASGAYFCCIPYNNDTKHLVGTDEEAPEYYRYWED